MTRKVGTYRTRNGNGFYKFGFKSVGSYYQVDIEDMPSYGNRSSDGHSTHRLTSDTSASGYRICFGNDYTVDSLSKAQKYAQGWAESTQDYIEKGIRF